MAYRFRRCCDTPAGSAIDHPHLKGCEFAPVEVLGLKIVSRSEPFVEDGNDYPQIDIHVVGHAGAIQIYGQPQIDALVPVLDSLGVRINDY